MKKNRNTYLVEFHLRCLNEIPAVLVHVHVWVVG